MNKWMNKWNERTVKINLDSFYRDMEKELCFVAGTKAFRENPYKAIMGMIEGYLDMLYISRHPRSTIRGKYKREKLNSFTTRWTRIKND